MMPFATHRYFIVNKPYNMVSQFVSPHQVGLLGDIDYTFPEGTHAIGRLDNHSEGLLILTTNKKVTKLLFESKIPHKRTYLVQVRHHVTQQSLQLLREGVTIRIKADAEYITTPCEAEIVPRPDNIISRMNDFEESKPHTWLLITLTEGKFHQVRKMTDALRHRTKRLIRLSVEDLQLGDLPPGHVREIPEATFFSQLKIDNW